jgi:hypothetical protein
MRKESRITAATEVDRALQMHTSNIKKDFKLMQIFI